VLPEVGIPSSIRGTVDSLDIGREKSQNLTLTVGTYDGGTAEERRAQLTIAMKNQKPLSVRAINID